VVGGMPLPPLLPAAGAGANFASRFGLHGDP
jgi:hypothetical protein